MSANPLKALQQIEEINGSEFALGLDALHALVKQLTAAADGGLDLDAAAFAPLFECVARQLERAKDHIERTTEAALGNTRDSDYFEGSQDTVN